MSLATSPLTSIYRNTYDLRGNFKDENKKDQAFTHLFDALDEALHSKSYVKVISGVVRDCGIIESYYFTYTGLDKDWELHIRVAGDKTLSTIYSHSFEGQSSYVVTHDTVLILSEGKAIE